MSGTKVSLCGSIFKKVVGILKEKRLWQNKNVEQKQVE